MYGSKRKKRTRLLCTHPEFLALANDCDGSHPHLPWGMSSHGWSTAQETEYPTKLCQALARICQRIFLAAGALDVPVQLAPTDLAPLAHTSKAAIGSQPRGKKLKPLVREHSCTVRVVGPQDFVTSLPLHLEQPVHLPAGATLVHPLPFLPAQAKRIKPPIKLGEMSEENLWESEYGIAWKPMAFIKEAAGRSHPGHFMDGVHPALCELFDNGLNGSAHGHAMDRTAQMRRWVLRLDELRCRGDTGTERSPGHVKQVLKGKNLVLFSELCSAAGSPDAGLAENMSKGFDLMGQLSTGGAFPNRMQHATLTPDQVRDMSNISRQAIWRATRRASNPDLVQDVYQITLDERDKGWLRGPFNLEELPKGSILTRRFRVQQSTTLANGDRTFKTRPIDDFSESLVNATNSADEAIQPMGIDMVLAALAMRYRKWGADPLVGKTIDLRKAYKNLPLSEEALGDAYICVMDPSDGNPKAFQSLVLPFGARAAVMGFCRVSQALWLIGVVVFRLHWTVFFDDFYLVAATAESRHVDLAQQLFFQLVGWEVSGEKEAKFDSIAKILGVQINLAETNVGVITICNVETRVKDLVAAIDKILERRTMSSAEMRILRGRLVFAEAQIYGRITGLHMQQLSRWEHSVGDAALDTELIDSLVFLKNHIILGGPRRVMSSLGRVFHLYTDACFEQGAGGLGGVLFDMCGNQLSYFSAKVNKEQICRLNPGNKETIIFELEALAVLVGSSQRGLSLKTTDWAFSSTMKQS